MIEWFGLGKQLSVCDGSSPYDQSTSTPAHFSENMGFVGFSPVLGGNLFSLMFGYYLDAHVPESGTNSLIGTRPLSLINLETHKLPSGHQCFDGKACYLGSLQLTLVACMFSLGLSWWAGVRGGQKIRARTVSAEW